MAQCENNVEFFGFLVFLSIVLLIEILCIYAIYYINCNEVYYIRNMDSLASLLTHSIYALEFVMKTILH